MTLANSLADLGYGENARWVEEEIERLFARHATKVVLGGRCRAPCSVWRSERILISNEGLPRFANRVHVFQEKVGRVTPNEPRHGPYLGFVSFRPRVFRKQQSYQFAYTAVAYITPPRYMLRPRYHILTTASGPAEGVLPFRASPFCYPNEDTAHRASCLHSALQSALLLKANAWACAPVTGQDMVAILWTTLKGEKTQAQLSKRAASLEDALRVLRDSDVNGGGVLETITVSHFAHGSFSGREVDARELVKLETHRLWADYLANACPIILALNLEPRPHSMLVLGMHLLRDPEDPRYEALNVLCDTARSEEVTGNVRVDLAELPGRFVAHDIRDVPFAEHAAAELLEEAWFEDSLDAGLSGISFLAITPRDTKLGIFDVRRLAKACMMTEPEAFWVGYFQGNHVLELQPPKSEDDMRYVTRLLQTGQVIRRYFSMMQRPAFLRQIGFSDERYWWAVEVRLPFRVPAADLTHPPLVYLWPTAADRSESPFAVIRFSQGPRFRGGPSKMTLYAGATATRYDFAHSPA